MLAPPQLRNTRCSAPALPCPGTSSRAPRHGAVRPSCALCVSPGSCVLISSKAPACHKPVSAPSSVLHIAPRVTMAARPLSRITSYTPHVTPRPTRGRGLPRKPHSPASHALTIPTLLSPSTRSPPRERRGPFKAGGVPRARPGPLKARHGARGALGRRERRGRAVRCRRGRTMYTLTRGPSKLATQRRTGTECRVGGGGSGGGEQHRGAHAPLLPALTPVTPPQPPLQVLRSSRWRARWASRGAGCSLEPGPPPGEPRAAP